MNKFGNTFDLFQHGPDIRILVSQADRKASLETLPSRTFLSFLEAVSGRFNAFVCESRL